MGENIYMMSSDMNLNIRSGTVGYNNKILVSDGLGKHDKVNTLELAVPTKIRIQKDSQPTVTHKDLAKNQTITHKEEKVSLILSLAGCSVIWYAFVNMKQGDHWSGSTKSYHIS